VKRLSIVLCCCAVFAALAVPQAFAATRVTPTASLPGVPSRASAGGTEALALSRLRSLATAGARSLMSGGGTNVNDVVELPYPNSDVFSENPSGTVDAVTRPDDVYWVYVEAGGRMQFYLYPATTGSQIALKIFSGDISDVTTASPLYAIMDYSYPETIDFRPTTSGYYLIDVHATTGSSTYTLPYDWYMSPNDDLKVNGVTAPRITASPMYGFIDYDWDGIDVSSVPLRKGDKIRLNLNEAPNPPYASNANFDLYLLLYGPSATSIYSNTPPVAGSVTASTPVQAVTYAAPSTGTYYVTVAGANQWGSTKLNWSVTPVRPSIKRSPSAAKLTYKRNAKFTLSAIFTDQFALRLGGYSVYLQTSSNGKKWKNTYHATTDGNGFAGFKFTGKKKGVVYFRWARLKSSTNAATYSGTQKVTIK
jgi:hypothetical protein